MKVESRRERHADECVSCKHNCCSKNCKTCKVNISWMFAPRPGCIPHSPCGCCEMVYTAEPTKCRYYEKVDKEN